MREISIDMNRYLPLWKRLLDEQALTKLHLVRGYSIPMFIGVYICIISLIVDKCNHFSLTFMRQFFPKVHFFPALPVSFPRRDRSCSFQ